MIKAIETRYKGYRFRSRLEARWAVAFDAMRIPWKYEPEGYVLEDGTWYLPDFYLPATEDGIFVEVKGDGRDWEACAVAEHKAVMLSRATGKTCLVVYEPGAHQVGWTADGASPTGISITGHAILSRAAVHAARSARFEHGESPR